MTQQKKTRIKLNVIDIAVLAMLLLAVLFLIVRGLRQRSTRVDPNAATENASAVPADFSPNLCAQMLLEDVSADLAERIAATEYRRIYNSFTLLDAYITDISVQQREDGRADIVFNVAAQIDPAKPNTVIGGNFNPIVGGQEVRVGGDYILKTLDIELTVTVTDMELLYAP